MRLRRGDADIRDTQVRRPVVVDHRGSLSVEFAPRVGCECAQAGAPTPRSRRLYPMASLRCCVVIDGCASKSAMVRASFKIR